MNGENRKEPLYVKAYHQLYHMINNNEFSSDKLPSEPELAKQLGISRMTLRQALAFLQDDGLIKNIHGKGNFIVKDLPDKVTEGLEKLSNPVYKAQIEPIEQVELYFSIDLDSEYTRQVLEKKSTAVVSVERWYKSQGKYLAFCFTYLPIDILEELGIDLHNQDGFKEILETAIYQEATHAAIEIKKTAAGNMTSQRYSMVGGDACVLLVETIYKDDRVLAHNKFYIPEQFTQLQLTVRK